LSQKSALRALSQGFVTRTADTFVPRPGVGFDGLDISTTRATGLALAGRATGRLGAGVSNVRFGVGFAAFSGAT
jgi:hypothetical protein